MDIFGAIVGIILFSPLMVAAAILVKIVSPTGPILADIPLRSGKNGKPFFMYKIRSMFPGAHEQMLADPVLSEMHRAGGYKLDPDPRLIPGAKYLRKSSVDEMPQFFNILKGDMSLVGPRPYFVYELIEQYERYPEAQSYVDKLKTVKPGLTGPWQVGGRSELTFVERAKKDAEYANRRSLMYDLLIILKTPFAVISSKGAV
ncbi:sugar transferase [candidate division WWE3 bacterium]|nr:sugar transferase [candidate division WWE3 bacterium]